VGADAGGETDAGTVLVADAGIDAGAATPDKAIVDLAFIIHLEGRDSGTRDAFNAYVAQIRELMTTFETYGAKLSFESESIVIRQRAERRESLVQGIQLFGDDIFAEALSRGHGVELHGGGGLGLETTMSQFEADLNTQKASLQAIGISPVSVSNICSALDWTTAVANTGFLFVTSLVEYCGKSLPIEKQSASTIACPLGRPGECHGPYPEDINRRLRPWRASGPDWVTPRRDGALVIIPSAYGLGCINEEMSAPGSYTSCPITDDDVASYLAVLEGAVLGARPGEVTSFIVVSSLGGHPTANELPIVARLLKSVQDNYVVTGKARFSTTKGIYNAFVARE
jgi:hypothetical protein